jgi:hypothetical protein
MSWLLKSGAARWQIPMGGRSDGRLHINIQLVQIGLVRSVDWERGTRMDHIVPARTTYPVTQVGYGYYV